MTLFVTLKCLSGTKPSFTVILNEVGLQQSSLQCVCVCVTLCPDWDSCSLTQHHKCPCRDGPLSMWPSDVESLRTFIDQPGDVSSPVNHHRPPIKHSHETYSWRRSVTTIIHGQYEWGGKQKKLFFVHTCQAALTSFKFWVCIIRKWNTWEKWATLLSNQTKTDRNRWKQWSNSCKNSNNTF